MAKVIMKMKMKKNVLNALTQIVHFVLMEFVQIVRQTTIKYMKVTVYRVVHKNIIILTLNFALNVTILVQIVEIQEVVIVQNVMMGDIYLCGELGIQNVY